MATLNNSTTFQQTKFKGVREKRDDRVRLSIREGHWKMARSYFPGTLNIHFKNGRLGEFQQFSIRKEFWETSSN